MDFFDNVNFFNGCMISFGKNLILAFTIIVNADSIKITGTIPVSLT